MEQLQKLAKLSNESRNRNDLPPVPFIKRNFVSWNPVFRDNVDVVFRGVKHLNSSWNVLIPQKLQGYRKESLISTKYTYLLNEPFISEVPAYASEIPSVIREITNDTAKPDVIFEWVGGIATSYDTETSKVYFLLQKCNWLTMRDQSGNNRTVHYYFTRATPPQQSFLHIMEGINKPVFCGGSGRTLQGNTNHSQPLRKKTLHGKFKDEDPKWFSSVMEAVNDGVSVLSLTPDQMDELEKLDDENASYHEKKLREIDGEYQHAIEEYDNISFLVLSVAAILSSASVACISLRPRGDRVVVVIVEACVVYSFLIIVSHTFKVFMREQTYIVDVILRSEGNFTYDGLVVRTCSEKVITAVGERKSVPFFLVLTEFFAIVASTGVSFFLALNLKQTREARRLKFARGQVSKQGKQMPIDLNCNRSHEKIIISTCQLVSLEERSKDFSLYPFGLQSSVDLRS